MPVGRLLAMHSLLARQKPVSELDYPVKSFALLI